MNRSEKQGQQAVAAKLGTELILAAQPVLDQATRLAEALRTESLTAGQTAEQAQELQAAITSLRQVTASIRGRRG